jgi:hypothetical protein
MNESITWGDYLLLRVVAAALGLALSFVLGLAIVASDSRYCLKCGRSMQWRWRRPHVYAKRRWCAFCDQEPDEP